MKIRDGMSPLYITVGPDHTLRQAAVLMSGRNVGSAIVLDLDGEGPGIITERDLMRSVAAGEDPDEERVIEHVTGGVIVASADGSLEEAAEMMVRGGFRHLVVVDAQHEIAGILSMRDIVRCWTQQPAAATS